MELWNEAIMEKTQKLLFGLKKKADFVVIGGWACYFWARTVKSKDLDIYINFKDFFALQELFSDLGIFITLNPKLKKYEAKIEEVSIDIYTPHHCNLIIPCKDVFKEKMFRQIEGFKVLLPEPLLILKLKAEQERGQTMKGFKDRIDILSLIFKAKIEKNFLMVLAKKYNFNAIPRLIKIIRESSKEYEYFFPEAKNLRALKKLKLALLKEWH